MASRDVLLELARSWTDVSPFLDEHDRAQIGLATFAVLQDGRSAARQVDRILTILYPILPAGHPVNQAIEATQTRRAGQRPTTRGAASELISVVVQEPPSFSPSGVAVGGELTRAALVGSIEERIARQADIAGREESWSPLGTGLWLSEATEGRLRYGKNAPLISVDHLGRRRIPAFQFESPRTSGPQEIPTVMRANLLLNVMTDPWGVLAWWWTNNGRLGSVPVDLLDTDREPEVLDAAADADLDSF